MNVALIPRLKDLLPDRHGTCFGPYRTPRQTADARRHNRLQRLRQSRTATPTAEPTATPTAEPTADTYATTHGNAYGRTDGNAYGRTDGNTYAAATAMPRKADGNAHGRTDGNADSRTLPTKRSASSGNRTLRLRMKTEREDDDVAHFGQSARTRSA